MQAQEDGNCPRRAYQSLFRAIKVQVTLAALSSDDVAYRRIKPVPAINHTLQILVKRCQEVTREALKMQRQCSAALLAVFAIAYTVFSCGENR